MLHDTYTLLSELQLKESYDTGAGIILVHDSGKIKLIILRTRFWPGKTILTRLFRGLVGQCYVFRRRFW